MEKCTFVLFGRIRLWGKAEKQKLVKHKTILMSKGIIAAEYSMG